MTTTLPALIGTEKQVAWARDLRAHALATIERRREWTLEEAALDDRLIGTEHEDLDTLPASVIERLVGQAEAEWWIDRRRLSTPELLVECLLGLAARTYR